MTCNISAGTICIKWGNAYSRDLLFALNETPINLTDYTIIWALKRDLNTTNDNTASATGTCTVKNQTTDEGYATFSITESQTKLTYGKYYVDFKVFNASDELVGNTSMFTIEIVSVSTQGDLPQ